MLNSTGKIINSVDQANIKLDKQIKKVLGNKSILSRIFKEVIDECQAMTYDEIEACIEGDVRIDADIVNPGYSNSITGLSQEDFESNEGLIRYDVKTFLKLPKAKDSEFIKIIVDVESQKNDNPGYDIPLRGIFYCCRMISSQLTTEFTVDTEDNIQYGNLKKVYSIWICTNTAQKRANCIDKYTIDRKHVVGNNPDNPRFDLLTVIVINISKTHNLGEENNGLIKMLTDLFDETMDSKTKIRKLEDEHGLPLTTDLEREVSDMCTYTENVMQQGKIEGKIEGETQVAGLMRRLLEAGRNEDALQAASSEEARKKFYKEFGIIDTAPGEEMEL